MAHALNSNENQKINEVRSHMESIMASMLNFMDQEQLFRNNFIPEFNNLNEELKQELSLSAENYFSARKKEFTNLLNDWQECANALDQLENEGV